MKNEVIEAGGPVTRAGRGFCPVLAIALLLVAFTTQLAGKVTPVGLRCEYLANPIGIDEEHPGLSWTLEAGDEGRQTIRGITQSAYHILVASSSDQLTRNHGDLWDRTSMSNMPANHWLQASAAIGRCRYGITTGKRPSGVVQPAGRWDC